jgi:hypothetical protein
MKTKSLLLPVLIVFGGLLASCSKEANVETKTLKVDGIMLNPSNIDTSSVKSFLCTSQWMYYQYFGDFHRTNSTLLYKLGRSNNAVNLDGDMTTYYPDNTFVEVTPTTTLRGYYKVLKIWGTGNENVIEVSSTIISPNQYRGTFSARLMEINDKVYMWYSESSKFYGVLVHASSRPVNGPGSVASRLTSVGWKYESYFGNYNQATGTLLYRMNRLVGTPQAVELADDWVRYYPNNTFTIEHIVPNTIETGTWWLTDNDTKLHTKLNAGNTNEYVGDINVLSNTRFEWTTSGSALYHGEMIPDNYNLWWYPWF